MTDNVNHPQHYTSHPSGIECIQITEHMGFNLGNALKYIWRCDLKRDAIEDLRKAEFYIRREIARREAQGGAVGAGGAGVAPVDAGDVRGAQNPDVGPRCGECRLGLGTHNTEDPYCDHHKARA